ncbi:hypothetical protein LLG46_06285 [bacterium]|nr:hypothetical protein [bacterium]
MRSECYRLYAILAVIALMGALGISASADPPSWSSFDPADVTGIFLTQLPTTDQLTYSLSMDSHPTITLSGCTYTVNWIQAYFLVSQDQDAPIEATNAVGINNWTWEYKSTPGAIAGWHGTDQTRIRQGGSKTLAYETLNIDNNNVLSGMHIGYQADATTEVTGWYKTTLISVPEPSSMIAIFVGLTSLIPIISRRRH